MGYIFRNWRYLGAWSNTTTYVKFDVVTYNGSSYVCLVSNTNIVPTNATYWGVVSSVGSAGAAGVGVPTGGTTGQVLGKASNTDYDTVWVTGGGGGGVTDGATLGIGFTFPIAGIHILDTDGSHDLIVSPGSNLTADRTLTITTGDANRNLTLSGDATITGNNTGDQDLSGLMVKSANLSDLTNVVTARSNLGVDAAGTDNSTNVTLAGSLDYITISGQVITRNAIDLATDITGNLPVGNLNNGTSASSATFWRGDGVWATPSGSGDVVGPASATDSVPVLFDGTTGKLVKNSTPTGTGNPVLATSPTLITPNIGAATSTSVNKVTITAPATGSTLTIVDGATLTVSATATVSGTNTGDQVLPTRASLGLDTTDTVTFANLSGTNTGDQDLSGYQLISGLGSFAFVTPTGTPTGSLFLRDDNSWQAIPGGGDALVANPLSQFAATTSSQLAGVISDETGSGALVFATSPTLVTPVLGTPTSGTLTNCTGLPISTGVSGLAANIATFLATPSSANLATAVTDETGTGALVFANTPTLVTPILGVATATTVNKLTITPPATGATLSIADGATLTASATASVSNTNTGDVTLGGSLDYITISGQVITRNAIDLTTDVTGILPNANTTATSVNTANAIVSRNADGAIFVGVIDSTSPTLTANTPVTITQTWNNAPTVFTAFQLNVANIASDPSSKFIDFDAGGGSIFSVTLTGIVTATTFVGALTGTASGNLPLTGGTLTGALVVTSVRTSEPTVTPTTGAWSNSMTLADGNHQTLDLTSTDNNGTLTLTVPASSSAGTIIVKQHGTTARDITWAVSAGTLAWMGTEPAWSSDSAGAVRIVSWRYNGSVMYLAATEVAA